LYLDESGIGKIAKDPYLVVAGVLINGDRQWKPLKEYLQSLLTSAAPSTQPAPSGLHAVDIYHGTGEYPREHWPRELRLELLDHIARIPAQFHLPVVWGLVDRAEHARAYPDETPLQRLIDCYAAASAVCFFQAEWYMRNCVGERELATIVIEQNAELQKRIKDIYRRATSERAIAEATANDATLIREILPITRVIDEPSFQEKTSSSISQIADFCAFAFKRAAGKQLDYQRFLKPLAHPALKWAPGQSPPIKGPFFDLSAPAGPLAGLLA
jgi:hypothetical protein